MTALIRPPAERRVFVDSSAYLALLDRKDDHHDQAVRLVAKLADHRYRQFTTNILLIEAHALILSALGRSAAAQFLTEMDDSKTVVIRVRASDEDQAKHILFHYADKGFSFADGISFAVMERLKIKQSFTFDQHFAQYGLAILDPDHF